MTRPYDEAGFSDLISQDRAWRLKEISDLKYAVLRADPNLQKVLLRALVTICYAHWEGSVKLAALTYLEYVAMRKLQYKQLQSQYLKNLFLPRISSFYGSKINIEDRCKLVESILRASDQRYVRVNEDLVATQNLNSDVFSDICLVCGVEIADLAIDKVFIDVVLLKRRNAIAHGENPFIGIQDLDTIADGTINLMRGFGNALENHVYLKTYRAAQTNKNFGLTL